MADTLLQRIRQQAQQNPDAESMRCLRLEGDDLVLSRSGFLQAAEGAAEYLAGCGVKRGDLVLIILEDLHLLTTVFIGTMALGAIPALLPFATEKLHPDRYQSSIANLINISKPAILVTQERLRAGVELVMGEHTSEQLPLAVMPESLLVPSPAFRAVDGEVERDEIVLVQHSSGTTGLQKGVALTHDAILQNLEASFAASYQEGDIVVSWLPLYHDMGLIANFLLPLAYGLRSVMIPTFYWLRSPQVLFKTISEHRATTCWMPNFAFNFCAQRCRPQDLEGIDLSSLRVFYNAGEPIYQSSFEVFLERFQPYGLRREALFVGYGMAEIVLGICGTPRESTPAKVDIVDHKALINEGHAQSVAPDHERARMVVSCGAALHGIDLRVVDANNQPIADRIVGEVSVRSDYVLKQYYNRPDLGDILTDGWLLTGDIGYMSEGELYLIGRKKDFIIVGGKNIYPSDIEVIVSETEGVYPGRVAVFGVPNQKSGTEDIAAIFELLPEYEDKMQAVSDAVRREVARRSDVMVRHTWTRPHGWLIKSSSGKIARSANRDKLREELALADWLELS